MARLIIVIPALLPTSSMDLLFQFSKLSDVGFLCITNNPNFPSSILGGKKATNKLGGEYLYEVKYIPTPNRTIAEAFFFEGIDAIEGNDFILRLDSDELISLQDLIRIRDLINSETQTNVFSFERLWVKKKFFNWFYNNRAGSKSTNIDTQIRLFRKSSVLEDNRIHTPGFQTSEPVSATRIKILHLIYIQESFSSRVKKVIYYDLINPGSGLSKFRYYLPELLFRPWVRLDLQSVELLDLWKLSAARKKENVGRRILGNFV